MSLANNILIARLSVVMFNAAPGADVLNTLNADLPDYRGASALAQSLVGTDLFYAVHGDVTLSAYADYLLDTLILPSAPSQVHAAARAWMQEHLFEFSSIGELTHIAIEALWHTPADNELFGESAQALRNKTDVALNYSLNNPEQQSYQSLKEALAGVGSQIDSVNSALNITSSDVSDFQPSDQHDDFTLILNDGYTLSGLKTDAGEGDDIFRLEIRTSEALPELIFNNTETLGLSNLSGQAVDVNAALVSAVDRILVTPGTGKLSLTELASEQGLQLNGLDTLGEETLRFVELEANYQAIAESADIVAGAGNNSINLQLAGDNLAQVNLSIDQNALASFSDIFLTNINQVPAVLSLSGAGNVVLQQLNGFSAVLADDYQGELSVSLGHEVTTFNGGQDKDSVILERLSSSQSIQAGAGDDTLILLSGDIEFVPGGTDTDNAEITDDTPLVPADYSAVQGFENLNISHVDAEGFVNTLAVLKDNNSLKTVSVLLEKQDQRLIEIYAGDALANTEYLTINADQKVFLELDDHNGNILISADNGVVVDAWRSGEVNITTGDGDDVVLGSNQDNIINGGNGADQLDGREGDDTLTGFSGNDVLIGGSGQDILYAYSGNNTLLGGDGDDTLYAGSGTDLMHGGNGADLFVLPVLGEQAESHSRIADFKSGTDKLHFSLPLQATGMNYSESDSMSADYQSALQSAEQFFLSVQDRNYYYRFEWDQESGYLFLGLNDQAGNMTFHAVELIGITPNEISMEDIQIQI
ncbi:calcium-binding protein [Oceanospirillum sediminis]|uniref:Haemolysin-type calcium binding-related domain-containing protein n=1 Tax=Oceanospirillum sediminis TaxID=2760088 RepID=A0A839ISB1_9GAMM|nr:calcium-binding protein [Oceanospirillum sediminis]MBB1487544.1 hypothetical protein [Oceanospirillum sediminis]